MTALAYPRARIGMAAPKATFRYGDVTEDQGSAFAEFLAEHTGKLVLIVVNSVGGSAWQGAADAAEVERHGQVIALGQGVVASAATLPFVAARRRVLHSAVQFMIHDPLAMAWGNSDTMHRTGAALDDMAENYAAYYARFTGHPVARIREWMRAETWLSAEQAVALRFADEVETSGPAASVPAADYTAFRRAPAALCQMTFDRGWKAKDGGAADPSDTAKKDDSHA